MIYELRASNAHRWMVCPGQPAALYEMGIPSGGAPTETNMHADKGTVAHGLLEIALRLDLTEDELQEYEGQFLKGLPQYQVEEAMIRGVGHAIDYTRAYVATHPKATVHPERELGWLLDDQPLGGTTDIALDMLPHELVIIDYKNGTKAVEVQDNPQLQMYSLSYIRATDRPHNNKTKFTSVIVQPNSRKKRGPVIEQEYTLKDLLEFEERVAAAVPLTRVKNPMRVAGDHCSYCQAAGGCRTYADYNLAQAKLDFEKVTEEDYMPAPKDLTTKDIAAILTATPRIRAWLDSVDSFALNKMLHGKKIKGFKLVASETRKKWDDPAKVIKLVPDKALDILAPRVPLTPPQMEKRLRKHPNLFNKMQPHVTRNPQEARVATEDDNRSEFING